MFGEKNYFCAMFKKRIPAIFFLLLVLVFTSCSEYQRVLKSTDLEYKLEKALELYEDGKYAKALPIFDELLTLYRGSEKAQDVYYYYAMTLFQERSYLIAAYHFKTFYQTFPNNAFADDGAFMVGYCYYKESPVYSLDQTNTYKAINELQLYINTHRTSSHIEECNMIIDELRGKLEKKSFMLAKQYWHTENYKAAIESFNATLSDYPDTPYREEAMYLRLESNYQYAIKSIVSLQAFRLKESKTAYLDFVNLYPESIYRAKADKILDDIIDQMFLLKQNPEQTKVKTNS